MRFYALSRQGKRSALTNYILDDRSSRLLGPLSQPFAMSNALEVTLAEIKDRENSKTAALRPLDGE
jgi:hypothetical protein